MTIDGTPAGIAPVYPWIFTGGIDPYLWRPIPGVQTMNFEPYRVDLTPFASVLDDGQSHTIALSVYNADSYFSATASLLLYLDPNASQLSGGVTTNTLAAPSPTITENIQVNKTGNIGGSVVTRNGHAFQISGYVNTSAGPVTTTLNQTINFSNLQFFKINATVYQQNIKQATSILNITNTRSAAGKFRDSAHYSWPLQLNYLQAVQPDGTFKVTTTVSQSFEKDTQSRVNGQVTALSLVQNTVTPTDTLDFDASGNFTGNENQSSAQSYLASDSTGFCYSRAITAAAGVLTSVVDGAACK